MTAAPLTKVVEYVRRVVGPAAAADISDGLLLERFLRQQDARAFEILVQRHAGLVLGVCERVLRHRQDAEDAFQATFMVLVRQGSSMMGRGNIAGWLYGVAFRTSLYARRRTARRRSVETRGSSREIGGDIALEVIWRDLRPVLDDELSRLPAKYRDPIVLCYLEGQTNEQAARTLGWTKGTVSGRLARARDLLRERLTRRGLALSSAIVAVALTRNAATAASSTLIQATVKAGAGVVAGTIVASAPVALLTEGVLHTMFLSKCKLIFAVVGTLGMVLASAGYYGHAMMSVRGNDDAESGQKDVGQKDDEAKLRLDDQERIVGKWVAIETERDGKREANLGWSADVNAHIEFTKDEMHFIGAKFTNEQLSRREDVETKYRLLPNKSPKMIEMGITLDDEKPKRLGIYAFEGDKLKLCLGARPGRDIPMEFKAPAGSEFVVYVLRRAQPSQMTDVADDPRVEEAKRRALSQNNLKQIMLAMHNFHSANDRFPGVAITSMDGTPLLSWRVALLRYLGQDSLYRQFRLNESWDSPHNKALVSKMPAVYATPGEGPKAPFKTFYRAFVGSDAFFSGKGGRRAPEGFPDGTSNTLAIFEAGQPVIWTVPEELPYASDKPLPRFGNWFANGFNGGLCDGSVRMFPHTIDDATIRALITPAGGEPIERLDGQPPKATGKGPGK